MTIYTTNSHARITQHRAQRKTEEDRFRIIESNVLRNKDQFLTSRYTCVEEKTPFRVGGSIQKTKHYERDLKE